MESSLIREEAMTTQGQLTAAIMASTALTSSLNGVNPTTLTAAEITALTGQAHIVLAEIKAFTPAPPAPTATLTIGVSGGGMSPTTGQTALQALGITPSTGAFMSFDDGGGGWTSGTFSIQASMVSIAKSLATFSGIKIMAVAMYAGTGDLGWNNNTDPNMVAAHTSAAIAAQIAGVQKVRMGWEFQTGTQNWPNPQPTPAQYVARFIAIVNIWRSAGYTGGFIFNPNGGVATPLTTWAEWDPGAQYADTIAIDWYFGKQNNVEVPTANFISGPHPNWNDIVANAKATGRTAAVMEFGCTGTSDDPTQIDGAFTAFDAAVSSGVPVLVCFWCDGYPKTTGTWGMQCSPAMWNESITCLSESI